MRAAALRAAALRAAALAALALFGCAVNVDREADPAETRWDERRLDPPIDGFDGVAPVPPPPITGGHLAVHDGLGLAAAADPGSRILALIDLEERALILEHALQGEPGRVAFDGDGVAHVLLRDIGAVQSVDAEGERARLRGTCPSPRGLAWDAEDDALLVACLDGRLQRLRHGDSVAETFAEIEGGDLRDVVPVPLGLWVTRFRTAEVLRVSRSGEVELRIPLPALEVDGERLSASSAWRAVPFRDGGLFVAHQRHSNRTVSTAPTIDRSYDGLAGGYGPSRFSLGLGEPCRPALVSAFVSELDPAGVVWRHWSAGPGSPVDVTVGNAALRPVLANTGPRTIEARFFNPAEPELWWCFGRVFVFGGGDDDDGGAYLLSVDQWRGELISHYRSPPRVVVGDTSIRFAEGLATWDAGFELFHLRTGSRLACASCHPEGGDDGVRWSFFELGPRRTRDLRGGLLSRAPFYWGGEMPSVAAIAHEVFDRRMGGGSPTPGQVDALAGWLDALPLPERGAGGPETDRGREVFGEAGCGGCHGDAGARVDLGPYRAPDLLGVGLRPPYMHDGCARSLREAITRGCAGDEHGLPDDAPPDDIEALLAYLRAL